MEKVKILHSDIEDGKEITHYSNGRIRVRRINELPTKTDQTQKDHCDINVIMKRYNKKISNVPPLVGGMQGDFSNLPSYQEALHLINSASESFNALPANVRKRFHNNPQELMEFLNNNENYDEAVKLGLVNKKSVPEQSDQNVTANKPKNANTKKVSNPETESKDE